MTVRVDAPPVPDPLPGAELAYAERLAQDVTNNIVNTDVGLNANKIAGLACTVIGQGRPVRIDYVSPGHTHTVDQKGTYAILLVNGAQALGTFAVAVASGAGKSTSCMFSRRLVLAQGVEYTFEIGKWIDSAGQGTFFAGAAIPMSLSVTQL